jgi:uncharacterized protein
MNLTNCAIVIMAKFPEPGKVKTRLQPFITPNDSAQLAMCFLKDTVNKAKYVSDNVIISFSPVEKSVEFNELFSENILFFAQTGNDLGERMLSAFRFAFEQKFTSVVMIGTDSPTFPTEFLLKAFEHLEKSEAVIGETTDGGFYLIGLNRLYNNAFKDIEWSSEKTFEQTKSNFFRLGIKYSEIPVWYDVDTQHDLEKLNKDKLLQEVAPFTFKYFEEKKDTKSGLICVESIFP